MAYKNAYQFVYSTNDSIDVQANNILQQFLNKTFSCANEKYANITGTTNTSRAVNQASTAVTTAAKLTGAKVQGTSLLQPLSIDQILAWDEYWVPPEDANELQLVLFQWTNDAIYECLEQDVVSSFVL